MKKIFMLLVLVLSISTMPAIASRKKAIQKEMLPQQARTFIDKHFKHTDISFAKSERENLARREYEVVFTNGDKIEFDGNGLWKDIDCKYNEVPKEAIPEQIAKYVKEHYKGARIIKIEKDRKKYEVKLSNRIKLKFNSSLQFIGYDD